jgi:hypothetical protein
MNDSLSFKYRSYSKDWIASYQLDDGFLLNFYCGATEDQGISGDLSVPDSIAEQANRCFPMAKKFWEDYITDMKEFFLIDEDCIKHGNYDVKLHAIHMGAECSKNYNLETFSKENILLRAWDNEGPFGLAEGWLVDGLGRVWESCAGDLDGWDSVSKMYPGEEWPLNKIPINPYCLLLNNPLIPTPGAAADL